METVIFQPLPLLHLSLPPLSLPPLPLPHLSLPLPLPLTENEKTIVDNLFNFCGSVACLLLHFIVLRGQNLHLLLLLYLLRLRLLFQTTLCFFFSDVRTRVKCRTVLFNLFVIAEPLMYFRVCHGTPTNKNLEITNCLQENQIFRSYNSKKYLNTSTNRQFLYYLQPLLQQLT